MDEPIKMKNNGQISIMLNVQKRDKAKKIEGRPATSNSLPSQHAILREIEEEMSALVGMQEVKKTLKEVYAWIYINKKREAAGLKTSPQALHMMFKGNPGT